MFGGAFSSSYGRSKLSTSPLPSSYSDAVHEKHRLTHSNRGIAGWFSVVEMPVPALPGLRARRVRVCVPTPILHHLRRRPVRRRGVLSLILMTILAIFTIFSLHKRFATRNKSWPEIIGGPPPTLVYGRSDLRRIWLWEIASGHYPSTKSCAYGISYPPIASYGAVA